jgi:hypothetical protein
MTVKDKNRSMHQAKSSKQDEFYTQLSDIEKELGHYKRHFEGKVVYVLRPQNWTRFGGAVQSAENCQMLCKEDNRRKSGK